MESMQNLDRTAKAAHIQINETAFMVEIARTDIQQMLGLMFRKTLEKDRGMLFTFNNERQRGVWMLFTRISLDILWIDGSGRVVHIEQKTAPHTWRRCQIFMPKERAKYVLEIPGGSCKTHSIRINDICYFSPLE